MTPKPDSMREWIRKPSATVITLTQIIASGVAPSSGMGMLMKKMPAKPAGWMRAALTTQNSSDE